MIYSCVPSSWWLPHIVVAGLFILFGVTDFFDGYVARFSAQETRLGTFLDPLADKILILSVVLPLVALGRIGFLISFVIIAREIVVTSLREVAVLYGVVVPVMWWGKIKTAVQLGYCAIVLFNPGIIDWLNILELITLMMTLVVTVWSGVNYCRLLLRLLSLKQ